MPRLASLISLGSLLASLMWSGVSLAESNAQKLVESFSAAQTQLVLAHGPWPLAMPPDPGNPLSGSPHAEKLGAYLFKSPALSGNGQISCATCHRKVDGHGDSQARAFGLGQHDRNTQGLFNVGLQRWFGWDGGADSLWAASLRPMLSPIEMGGAIHDMARELNADSQFSSSQAQMGIADASDEGTVVFAAQSIGAYLRTIQSPRTSFDQFRDALASSDYKAIKRYPSAAKRGLQLFVGQARCHVCHYGPNFSNGEFHDIGRPFLPAPGRVDPGRYRGITRVRNDRYNLAGQFSQLRGEPVPVQRLRQSQTNWGQWRTPSLRNLTQTAPYMHDGSLKTLREVVDWYTDIDVTRLHSNGETLLQPLKLTDAEREDLVAFLKTLSQ